MPIDAGTDLYGTGEVAGPLLRNGTRDRGLEHRRLRLGRATTPSLYQSHPWVLAVRADGTRFGVLADTPERCLIDLTRRHPLRAPRARRSRSIVIEGDDAAGGGARAWPRLTGTMPLPPRWALGYHQCRYSYTPDDRVREIAASSARASIPCDVIWLDIDYMDGYRRFTFDPLRLPRPARR